jgi:hypothetical protein
MDETTFKTIVANAKKDYYQIGHISCPAFGDEGIHFNKHGWNHLIRKGRKFREQDEQLKRIGLVPHAVRLILESGSTRHHRTTTKGNSQADFWELRTPQQQCNPITPRIRVIIRKTNNGRLHFFSVFPE